MCIISFFTYVCFSVIAPFFPGEAADKGATNTEIGLIFGSYEFVCFLAAPIAGKYMSTVGAKFMYISGLAIRGTADILFGFLNLAPDGDVFVIMCFITRMSEACGTGAFCTAAYAIVAKEFPGKVSMMFGWLQTFNGIGLMLGPLIGGFLYSIGGFKMPFLTLGTMVLFVGIVAIFVLPNTSLTDEKQGGDEVQQLERGESVQIREVKNYNSCSTNLKAESETSQRVGSLFRLVKLPGSLAFMGAMFYSYFALCLVQPLLEIHLEQFGLSSMIVGTLFFFLSGAFALTSPLWGYLGDKYNMSITIIGAGYFLQAIAAILIGPAPFLMFDTQLWLVVVSLILTGIGTSCLCVASFKYCVHQAIKSGLPNNLHTYGQVSGLWNALNAFGAFVAPTVSGVMVDQIGIQWIFTVFGFLLMLMMLMLCVSNIFSSIRNCCKVYATSSDQYTEKFVVADSEKLQLLND